MQWKAFEYEYREHSNNWFTSVWIIAFAIFITTYLQNNVLFGILILLFAFSASIFATRRPNLIRIYLNHEEIQIADKNIDLRTIYSFCIDENKILLKSRQKTKALIIIPLEPQVDREEIKEYLIESLKEEELHESILHLLLEKLGF